MFSRGFPVWIKRPRGFESQTLSISIQLLCSMIFHSVSIIFYLSIFFVFMFYQLLYQLLVPHSPGVMYYHLLSTRDQNSYFQIRIWDHFVHRGHKSYTPTAFRKLWTAPGVICMKHASS